MVDVDRGSNGRTPRVRSLNVESRQDFISGFREWMATDMDGEIRLHAEDLLRRNGVADVRTLDISTLRGLFDHDPLIASRMRLWITNQRQMWASLDDQFNTNLAHYLGELDAAEDRGPGLLQLDPNLDIPDYCRHEIHIQPGGYVGDELAGPLYHYGTNSFYMGQNDSDEFHIALATRATRPADGKVAVVVDLGCGIGQLTCLRRLEKSRFLTVRDDTALPFGVGRRAGAELSDRAELDRRPMHWPGNCFFVFRVRVRARGT